MRRVLTLLLLSAMLAACGTTKEREEQHDAQQVDRALPVIPDIY